MISPITFRTAHPGVEQSQGPPPQQPSTTKADFADIAGRDGDADWKKYAASGKQLAIVKMSEGGDWQDPKGAANRAALAKQGLYAGLYHFAGASHANKINPPEKEADFFLSLISPLGPKEFPVLDYELPYDMTPEQQADWVGKWCARVEEKSGKAPWVYSYTNMVKEWGDSAKPLTHYPLWLADYTQGDDKSHPPSSQAWDKLTAWQYTSKASFEGLPKSADGSFLYLNPPPA